MYLSVSLSMLSIFLTEKISLSKNAFFFFWCISLDRVLWLQNPLNIRLIYETSDRWLARTKNAVPNFSFAFCLHLSKRAKAVMIRFQFLFEYVCFFGVSAIERSFLPRMED